VESWKSLFAELLHLFALQVRDQNLRFLFSERDFSFAFIPTLKSFRLNSLTSILYFLSSCTFFFWFVLLRSFVAFSFPFSLSLCFRFFFLSMLPFSSVSFFFVSFLVYKRCILIVCVFLLPGLVVVCCGSNLAAFLSLSGNGEKRVALF